MPHKTYFTFLQEHLKRSAFQLTFFFFFYILTKNSLQFSSVAQSCLALYDPMDCSMPGFPVHRQFPELAKTHVYQVSDAIQPSHPLSVPFSFYLQSFPSSGSFPRNQFFTSGDQSIGVSASPSVLPKNILDWFPLGLTSWISLHPRDSQ